MERAREGDVAEGPVFPIPAFTSWMRVMGTNCHTVSVRTKISHGMLGRVAAGQSRMRGMLINRVARELGVPATILVRCNPYDKEGRPWARRAVLAEVRRRLTPAS